MNSPTSGLSANCSKLLVSDTTNFFDQNMCFLKDVLVSKQKISYLVLTRLSIYMKIYYPIPNNRGGGGLKKREERGVQQIT